MEALLEKLQKTKETFLVKTLILDLQASLADAHVKVLQTRLLGLTLGGKHRTKQAILTEQKQQKR